MLRMGQMNNHYLEKVLQGQVGCLAAWSLSKEVLHLDSFDQAR